MNTLDVDSSRQAIDIHTQNARLEITNNLSRRMKIRVVRPRMVVERRAASFRVENSRRPLQNSNNGVHLKKLVLNKNLHNTHPATTGSAPKNSLADDVSYSLQLQHPEYSVELQDSQMQSLLQPVQLPTEGSRQIVWDPGYLKVDWEQGGIEIEWDENTKPDIQVSPHSVEITVKGRKLVHIAVVENKVPGAKGRKINKRV